MHPSTLLAIEPAGVKSGPASPSRRRTRRAVGTLGLVTITGTSLMTGGLVAFGGETLAATGDNATVIAVAKAVSPSVVTIEFSNAASAQGRGSQGLGQGGALPVGGSGSGVIIDANGLVLTNRHVAGSATDFTVTLQDGRQFPAKAAGVDTLTDFGFVQIQGASDLPVASLGESSNLQVGQLAIVFGNPGGDLPDSVTAGIISGLDREIVAGDQSGGQTPETLRHVIQTDAAINPGNSGGPLVDGDGKVIGISTATDGSAQGIGFALPIDLAKPIIAEVLAGKPITRPWIGVQYLPLDTQLAKDNNLSVSAGAWVHASQNANGTSSSPIVAGSPAEAADLKEGDIITALDGQAIDATHPLDVLLLQKSPGDAVTLTVLRDGNSISVPVTLGTRPTNPGQ
jgi:S1-C subfamily serine protease